MRPSAAPQSAPAPAASAPIARKSGGWRDRSRPSPHDHGARARQCHRRLDRTRGDRAAPSRRRALGAARSRIVVRRPFDHRQIYVFRHSDDRLIFVSPYEHDFTLIGMIDNDFTGDPAVVAEPPVRSPIFAPPPIAISASSSPDRRGAHDLRAKRVTFAAPPRAAPAGTMALDRPFHRRRW